MKKGYKKGEVVLRSFNDITKNMKLKDKLNILEEWMLEYSKKEQFEVAALLKKERENILTKEASFLNKIYYKTIEFFKNLLDEF